MEITKGENANLAGMEPRCPKCGSTQIIQVWRLKDGFSVSCYGCGAIFKTPEESHHAQFFRSPAPTPPLDRKMLEAVAEDGLLVTWDKDFKFSFSQVVRLMAEFAIEHIASPAQPEKRDDWVSVDERFPELGQPVLVFFGRLDPPYSSVWTYSGDNRYFRKQPSDTPHEDVTHWQPLPAPPQSGKEGQ